MLKREYRVQEVIDYSGLEADGLFLEGTGAMILDHAERVAYVGASTRADPIILERFCTHFGFEPMVFENRDPAGHPIYHTNVILSIGTEFALLCTEVMTDAERRDEIVARLRDSGRDVIDISWQQVTEFAGNGMELTGSAGRFYACSARAAASSMAACWACAWAAASCCFWASAARWLAATEPETAVAVPATTAVRAAVPSRDGGRWRRGRTMVIPFLGDSAADPTGNQPGDDD